MPAADSPAAGLELRAAVPADARLIFDLTLQAYAEYRDWLVPASGVFSESVENVERDIRHGGGVLAFVKGYEIFDYEQRPGFGRVSADMRKRLSPKHR